MKLTLLLPLLLLSGAASANDAALRQCRAMADGAARLACYDALPLGAPAAVSPPAPEKIAAAVPASVAPTALPAPAPAPPALASTFGLQRADEVVQEVSSSLPGLFEGWSPGQRIRLANGQLWQISDDSSGVYYLRDPKVTVRRAALGSFVLDIDGAKRMPRVRRLE